MDSQSPKNTPIIIEQNPLAKNIFDVNIDFPNRNEKIKSYEIQLMIFPYSRLISAKDFTLYPFQEIRENIEQSEDNTYSEIIDSEDKGFGIALSLIIFLIFLIFTPKDIFSLQSIITLLGTYAIGKEFWHDLESFLVDKTKGKKIRFLNKVYKYQQNPLSTIFSNWKIAEERRYGITSIHPDEFAFTNTSNSIVLKSKFEAKSLNQNNKNHFCSFHIKKSLTKEFLEKGFLIGSKITINKKAGFILVSTEYFQTFDKGKYGSRIDDKWQENTSFIRYTISIWRIKFYLDAKVMEKTKVIQIKLEK